MTVSALALLGDQAAGEPRVGDYVPHVVAWNLTARCNLTCAHCYIAAGPAAGEVGELGTAECLGIMDQILALNPSPMFILSGGEPLLRQDLTTLSETAADRGATVVVGTNGTLLTDAKIVDLKNAGVSGVAVSVESLDPHYHDRFRRGHGALRQTLEAVDRLARHRLDFVVQTTLTRHNRPELARLADWAADRGAVAFNAYFLVATGRGERMGDLDAEEYEEALEELVALHRRHLGRTMVRAKCAPHFMRLVHRETPESPILNYRTRCPCGVDYCRVTPDGKVTPCPYLPAVAGDLRRESFAEVWRASPLFRALRDARLGGRCGRCEYRALCGGCRARAFAATGDYLAEDPSCAYDPTGTAPVVEPRGPVMYGTEVRPELQWTAEALARVERVPSFVRGVVVKRVEAFARSRGLTEVTPALLRDVRQSMPVDFSKRLPFFLRDDDA